MMAQARKETIILRNMGMKKLILKRAETNVMAVLDPMQLIELKIYKDSCFIGIDWENQRVIVDTGNEATS